MFIRYFDSFSTQHTYSRAFYSTVVDNARAPNNARDGTVVYNGKEDKYRDYKTQTAL